MKIEGLQINGGTGEIVADFTELVNITPNAGFALDKLRTRLGCDRCVLDHGNTIKLTKIVEENIRVRSYELSGTVEAVCSKMETDYNADDGIKKQANCRNLW